MNLAYSDEIMESLLSYYALKGEVVFLEDQLETSKSYLAVCPQRIISCDYGASISEMRLVLDELEQDKNWKFGFFSYDLKNAFHSKITSTHHLGSQLPELWFMIPEIIFEVDYQNSQIKIVQGEISEKQIQEIENLRVQNNFEVSDLKSLESEERYKKNIELIQNDIREGSYYELNYSRLLSANFSGSSLGLYKSMKKVNPVPMAAYIFTDDWQICSASPEVFLIKQQNKLTSKPIKGTRKRIQDNNEKDFQMKNELLNSEKERAENLMIVDLVRNDLNQIAQVGSVFVKELFTLKSYATVHQMESTIEALVKEDISLSNLFKAIFPMGSMTGAPKIAAMQAIDFYENYRRNVYSGCIGYFSPNFDFMFSVVIRTAIIQQNRLYYGVGGAITSDSNPDEEWHETCVKMEVLKKAISKPVQKYC